MVKMGNSAGLSNFFDFIDVSIRISRKKLASTTIVVTFEKSINPTDTTSIYIHLFIRSINKFDEAYDKLQSK